MANVSETIVREFFEAHGFLVCQQRKYVAPTRREEEKQVDFLALNPRPPISLPALPFVLSPGDMAGLARAIVVVRGWHTETFSPAVLAGDSRIFRFVSPAIFRRAERGLGGEGPATHLLVVPALPADEKSRQQSIDLLRSKGVDAVLPFRMMLTSLIDRIEVNRNYQKSDLLQMLRILKNYDFFREAQLELFKPRRRPKSPPDATA
jgi:hypothetical protein